MKYIIEKATVSDAKELDELLTKLIHYEKKYNNNINDKYIVKDFFSKYLEYKNVCAFKVVSENKIIGYIYGFIKNENSAYLESIARLDSVYIEEEYRNKGIGRALIKEFKIWIKNKKVKHVEVEVLKENDHALKLYKDEGFKIQKHTLITKIK